MLTGTETNAGISLASDDATAALTPGDRRSMMARLHEAVAHGSLFEVHCRIRRSDGVTTRVLRRRAAAEDGRDGSAIVRGIVRDVSELGPSRDAAPPTDPLDRTTDHILQARRIATETDNRLLLHLIDIVLMHLGRSLTARLAHSRSSDVH